MISVDERDWFSFFLRPDWYESKQEIGGNNFSYYWFGKRRATGMADASEASFSPEAIRLRAEVREQRYRDIAESLTARTTVEAIEAAYPSLADSERTECHPVERAAMAAEWRAFRSAVAEGGEVWAFREVGSCSSSEGFAVVSEGLVVADCVTSISTWI
jgi:hypothetical protein